jgi:hypothetical protein
MRRAFIVTAVALLGAPGVAAAAHNGRPTLYYFVQPDGSGVLTASYGHPVAWERCAPDGGCAPYQDADGDDQRVTARDEAPGTRFRATQDGVTLTSEPWSGRVRARRPPGVEGEVRVGGRVRPNAADWLGGWGRETDWLQLQACRTEAGADCRVIYDEIKFGECSPGGGRRLPARYEGWWLRVADARIDTQQPFTQEGYLVPEGVAPHEPSEARAVAVVGRIAEGPAPGEDCMRGGPQIVTLRRAIVPAERGRLVVADIGCPFDRCAIAIRLRQGGRTVTERRTLRGGRTAVALPRRAARRLRSGRKVAVRVVVEGRVVALARLPFRRRW